MVWSHRSFDAVSFLYLSLFLCVCVYTMYYVHRFWFKMSSKATWKPLFTLCTCMFVVLILRNRCSITWFLRFGIVYMAVIYVHFIILLMSCNIQPAIKRHNHSIKLKTMSEKTDIHTHTPRDTHMQTSIS